MTYPSVPEVVKFIQPLSQCTIEDLTNNSAIVYGRAKLYHRPHQTNWHWSEFAWWKGAWIDGKGPPSEQCRWKIYCGSDLFSDYGHAEITFFIRLPSHPTNGWHKP